MATRDKTYNYSVAASGAPAWFNAMTDATWTALSGNTLQSVAPVGADIREVVNAWNGACYDQVNNEFLIAAAGGHSGYGGNEIYRNRTTLATPVWDRLSNPSSTAGGDDARNGVGSYGDGRIRSSHMANHSVFAKGRIWLTGISGMSSGPNGTQGTTAIWSWDRTSVGTGPFPVANSPWTYHGKGKTTTPFPGGSEYSFEYGKTMYDAVGEDLWNIPAYAAPNGGYKVNISNVNAPVATSFNYNFPLNPFGEGWGVVVAEDTTHRWIIMGSANESRLWVIDLNNTGAGPRTVNTTGTATWLDACGACYDPATRKILIHHHALGATVRTLTVPTNPYTSAASGFVWGSITNGSGGVTPPGTIDSDYNGMFDRFQLANNMGNGRKCLFAVHRNLGPMYAYKVPVSY